MSAPHPLRRGENATIAAGPCELLVDGITPVWLVPLGADDRLGAAPPQRSAGRFDPSAVPSDVRRVLVLGAGGSYRCRVTDADGRALEFAGSGTGDAGIALIAEFYRRPDGSWKFRALGETFVDRAALQRIHGVELPDPVGGQGAGPTQEQQPSRPSSGVVPDPDRNWPRIVAGIWEDASRSSATFADAQLHAERNRDADLERLVADPAGRSPDHPHRAEIEERYSQIVDRASGRRLTELDHLVAELAELERSVPAPMARWSSGAWAGLSDDPSPMVRLGELTRGDSSVLRIPMLRERAPIGGHLLFPWDDEHDHLARAVVRRLLAAGRAGRGLLMLGEPQHGAAQWASIGPGTTDIDGSLAELCRRLDLAQMAVEAGMPPPPDVSLPAVVVMVLDGSWVPSGDVAQTIGQIRRVAMLGPRHGVSTVFLADDDVRGTFGDGVPAALVPLVAAQVDDPWVGAAWDFHPDDGAPDDAVADAIHLRAQPGR